jgi:sulfur transfer protein SufE
LEASTEIIDKIGLRKHLTQQRNNGLNAMIDRMRMVAKHYI